MTFSRDDGRPKLTIRVKPELKEELKNTAEIEDTSMSQIVRNGIKNEVSKGFKASKSRAVPPDAKELKTAWKILDKLAGESDQITFDNGLNQLSQQMGKPESVILECIIKPLEYRGYLRVFPRVDSVIIRLNVRP